MSALGSESLRRCEHQTGRRPGLLFQREQKSGCRPCGSGGRNELVGPVRKPALEVGLRPSRTTDDQPRAIGELALQQEGRCPFDRRATSRPGRPPVSARPALDRSRRHRSRDPAVVPTRRQRVAPRRARPLVACDLTFVDVSPTETTELRGFFLCSYRCVPTEASRAPD